MEISCTSANLLDVDCKPPEVMATVGPTLEKRDDLVKAIEAGARWFRLPCGYRQRPHLLNAQDIRAAAEQCGSAVNLLMDLPSSRPRTGAMPELRLHAGDRVIFWDPEKSKDNPAPCEMQQIPLPGLSGLRSKLEIGNRLWFCDAQLEFQVAGFSNGAVLAELKRGNIPLKTSNAVYLPDNASAFYVFTPKDAELLESFRAAEVYPDWMALSFVSTPEDVDDARQRIQECLGRPVKIMAKFETNAAVSRAAEIINAADGLMVARGDLLLAVGHIKLPAVQEELVAAAHRAGKIAVVATQFLEVFSQTGLPSRSELSDLSLAARQHAHAVMLGKETVYSPWPIQSINLAKEVLTSEGRRFAAAERALLAGAALEGK